MKKFSILLVISLFLATILNAGYEQKNKILTSTSILQSLIKSPKTKAIEQMLKDSKAIAIFPNSKKNALIFGVILGNGIMSVKNKNGEWSNPIFIKLKSFSVGFQIGYRTTDIVMFFKDSRSIAELESGKIIINSDISAVAISKDAKKIVLANDRFYSDIKNSSTSRGLYIGISVGGGMLTLDENNNFDYYDKLVYIDNILNHDQITDSSESKEFKKVLNSL